MTIISHFPFQSMRPYQKDVMDSIESWWDSYNYIFLEAPTGFGKSPVAYAIAKWLFKENNSYTHFLVSDIYLQNQYLRDFNDIALIKGRSNFICSVAKRNVTHLYDSEYPEYPDCADAPCILDTEYPCAYKPKRVGKNSPLEDVDEDEAESPFDEFGVKFNWADIEDPHCSYWKQKDIAIHSPLTIHNYHYFLNEMMFSHSFAHRELSILDEAHTIESMLMSFIEMAVTRRTLKRITDTFEHTPINIPYHNDIMSWRLWLGELRQTMQAILNKFGTARQVSSQGVSPAEIRNRLLVMGLIEKVSLLISNISTNPDNWVWNNTDEGVVFRPVTVAPFAHSALFEHTNKHLLVSATILDSERLKSYLGIKEDVKFLRVGSSNFPPANRPLFVRPVGKATQATLNKYLSDMLQYLDHTIIPQNISHKGVIHTHTNAIAQFILTNSIHRRVMMSNLDQNREDVFQSFFESSPPMIMVTPSMRLGVDLHDDLARWQVLCKVPYPYLGDPQIKKRSEIDGGWYEWQTLMSLIQTYGRVCRSDSDWGNTFILDGKFNDIIYKNWQIIPKWFKEAIRR